MIPPFFINFVVTKSSFRFYFPLVSELRFATVVSGLAAKSSFRFYLGTCAAVKLILINYLMLNLFGFYHGNLGEQLATFQYTKIIKPKVFLKRLLSLSINIPIPLFLYSKYEL